MTKNKQKNSLFFSMLFLSTVCFPQRLPLPDTHCVLVGKLLSHKIQLHETMANIARQYDLGYFELIAANPQVNPRAPKVGTTLIIPTQFILPSMPHKGIIINIGTMRLFYFPKGKKYFFTYPVGIGKQDWGTPVGKLSIIQKMANPTWFVPNSIYAFRKAEGNPVPHQIPPGPDNPLGDYALRLSKSTYLIHGTNEPSSVGVRSSAGCIHLYPEDIENLFGMISVGEKVTIINQPYEMGWNNDTLYLSAHLPLAEDRQKFNQATVETLGIEHPATNRPTQIDWESVQEALQDHTGIPMVVGQVDHTVMEKELEQEGDGSG